MIKRPQKAPSESITNEQLELLDLPVYGSPKIDAFRCVVSDCSARTSSMKPMVNEYVQSILSRPEYNNLEGELAVGEANDPDLFNKSTGPLRRIKGEPEFNFYVFDHIENLNDPYNVRYEKLLTYQGLPFVTVIIQRLLHSIEEIIQYDQWCVEQGFEGCMIRSTTGKYKQGRCTLKEKNIFKRKPVADDEAIVIGFEEQMENTNESRVNELGVSTRSTHSENLVPKGTLGAFIMKSNLWKEPFRCGTGTGLTDEKRKEIWDNKEKYLGSLWVYKYQKYGSIDAPRQPILKGPRDPNDMTDY